MTRWLAICLGVYVPHIVDEALTGMHDDPIIAAAFAPLSHLSARHAAYLVFQVMLVTALATAYLVRRGGAALTLVMWVLALALIGEGHHLVRAAWSLDGNPGLFTSLPMPIAGALLARALWQPAVFGARAVTGGASSC